MSRLPLPERDGGGRFPGFDSASQSKHWDAATQSVVMARLGLPVDVRFFTPGEEAAARALLDQLLDQRGEPRVPVVHLVDARLAEQQTDGWHYDDMPIDGQAWRDTLAALDEDARAGYGCIFAEADLEDQEAMLRCIQERGMEPWHSIPAAHVWSLWTRYACTAFYSHPWAWDEIGFAGPAYPRGYKNLGLDAREPFEVADARPAQDPAVEGGGTDGFSERSERLRMAAAPRAGNQPCHAQQHGPVPGRGGGGHRHCRLRCGRFHAAPAPGPGRVEGRGPGCRTVLGPGTGLGQ